MQGLQQQSKGFVLPTLLAPYEDDQNIFIKSFDISEEQQIREFFVQYGFVVVRDVLSNEDLTKTKQEIWKNLQQQTPLLIDENNSQTWENVDQFDKAFGIINSFGPVMLPQALQNRINPKIYNAFKAASLEKFFLVNMDRYGFMRPTKNHPEWKTVSNWLHLDQNPLTGKQSTFGYDCTHYHEAASIDSPQSWQNNYFQGVLAIEDCPIETGGLLLVTGFHQHIMEWTQANYNYVKKQACSYQQEMVQIAQDDPINKQTQKIPIRRGSIAIWDGRMVHANFPNTGDKPRFVQYISYKAVGPHIKSPVKAYFSDQQTAMEYQQELSQVQMTELGQMLLGFKEWQTNYKQEQE